MPKSLWLLLAVLLMPAAGAPAAARPESAALRAWRGAAVALLGAREDAKSLATAAVLSGSGGPELATRASEADPDNPALAWIRLRLCSATPGCDFRDAATAMRWIDADNPAAWLPTLTTAQKDKDTIEVDRVLADMAQGKHFDLYVNPIAVLMFDALQGAARQLPRDVAATDAARLELVTATVAAKLTHKFHWLEEACREAPAASERRESCLKVAKQLQNGDSIAGQFAGLALEKRFLPPDGREAQALAERRLVLEWRVAAAGKFDKPLLPWAKNARARWRLARMRSMRREEEVLLAILREQGTPLYPPASKR